MSTKASKKAKLSKEGLCKLTGKYGKFVAAHILPRALTRLSRTGEKIRETALGATPRWKPPTWYDNELVIREGEDILEAIDTPAIEALRNHTLIWSSFNSDEPFAPEALTPLSDSISLREACIDKADELRLFFLSIVWRAAASSRREFVDVKLTDAEIEDLRQRVLAQEPGNAWEYPVILDQLITWGPAHNRTPIVEDLYLPGDGGSNSISVASVRIYLDGLVARVMLAKEPDLAQKIGNLCLGANDKTVIFARKFGSSRTNDNMREIILDNIKRGHV